MYFLASYTFIFQNLFSPLAPRLIIFFILEIDQINRVTRGFFSSRGRAAPLIL